MTKPVFAHHSYQTVLEFSDYEYIDYLDCTPKTFHSNLKFLIRFSPVVIKNYPVLLWGRINTIDFENPVVILSQLKTRLGYTILKYGSQNITPKKVELKAPTMLISNWFNYWKYKGVLSTNIVSSLHKLTWKSRL